MLYIAHEKPPISVTLIAGMQHALIAMMLVIYLVITGTDIGLSDGSLRGFICMGVVVMGFGTVLNGLNTRVSAGHTDTLPCLQPFPQSSHSEAPENLIVFHQEHKRFPVCMPDSVLLL
jgi:hypothetical protein